MIARINFYLNGCRPALLLVILLVVGCSGNEPSMHSRPNILLILVDDLGNNDIPSWGDGSAPTPNLDRLSLQSVRFRQNYTDSTCSPSRASLLTGKRAVEVGFQANGLGLSQDLPTLPKSLKALGYRTAHIGKWHVGEALEYPKIAPGNQGFDYWWGALNHFVLRGPGPNGEIVQGPSTHIDPWLQENGEPPQQYRGYLDDLLVDKAISQINRADQPWFINLWLHSPHSPHQPSPYFKAQYPETPEGTYLAVLRQLDHNIARLLNQLDKRAITTNTIVVFASDNGSPIQARNDPLIGAKATYLEGGVRTPLLVRWPDHIRAHDVYDVSDISDIYPTLLKLAGGEIPDGLTGRDLGPALRGESLGPRQPLYWASEVGQLGMIFGGTLFDQGRGFFREMFGNVSSYPITPAIGLQRTDATIEPFAREETQRAIAAWEKRARRVDVNWSPKTKGGAGQLSGLDFQRAPVFGGYSLGLEVSPSTPGEGEQTLVDQRGVWRLSLDTEKRLNLQFGEVALQSDPVQLDRDCNTLVVSFDVQPAYSHPFKSEARSRSLIYVNEKPVLDSAALLTRPSSAAPLANPTYIGVRHDGEAAYSGTITNPIIINKLLLQEQDGYRLQDMQAELCLRGQP